MHRRSRGNCPRTGSSATGPVRGLGHAHVASSHRADSPNKAQAYAEEHLEQADKGINEVAGFAERDTHHQHDEQIDRAVAAAEQYFGQDQDQQGNQN